MYFYDSAFIYFGGLIFTILIIVVIAAWIRAISLFIDAAKEKGYYEDGKVGDLWFIGIFATPITVGIYTTALPDKRHQNAVPAASAEAKAASVQDELPSI